jgi:DNA mismatch repair ATPase MutL
MESSPIKRLQTVKNDLQTDGIPTKDSLTKSETQRNETFLRFTAEQYVKEILPNIVNEGLKRSEPQAAKDSVEIKNETEIKPEKAVKVNADAKETVAVLNKNNEDKQQPQINEITGPENNDSSDKQSQLKETHIEVHTNRAEILPEKARSIPEVSNKKLVKRNYRVIGEAFNSYVIVELEDRILLVDKHAAHERIIFEDMKQNMETGDVVSQFMMIPVEVMLMSDEITAIEEYRAELEAVGFEFTCSRNTVSVTAIPSIIEHSAVADMFTSVAEMIKSSEGGLEYTRSKIFEAALYQASCKAAIKAGREYVSAHVDWIVEKLMSYPEITFCPHGRPVAMEITKSNISRQFGRT